MPEDDAARREGLLTLADGWIGLIERREAIDEPGPQCALDDPEA
ncbi:hypothetical protein [Brevundimonas sp. NIBR10]|nr:hypothetical protein [Brevundimonas sp. NIBR10]